MPLVKLDIPAGAVRNGTEYETGGRWRDMSLVRFYNGVLQPINGWRKRVTNQLTGIPRAMHTWRENDSTRWLAIGTNSNLYAFEAGNTLDDITPADLTAGSATQTGSVGYGVGGYGDDEWGTPRPEASTTLTTPAAVWSLDNWGEYLVGVLSSDGRIFEWDLSAGTASVISNAPVGVDGVIVTEERIIFALGAQNDPRRIDWCDQEDNTTWTASATNQAGNQILATNGKIVTGSKVRGGTLILTDIDAHLATYLGQPFVYRFDRVGTGCGAASQGCVVQVDVGAVWMGRDGFWIYDGTVRPLESPIADYVFRNLNESQITRVTAFNNSKYGEVWWLYPSGDNNECNRYAAWSYRNNTWMIGELERTAGTDGGIFGQPIMVTADGYVYDHEVGWNYDGNDPFAETGPIEIGQGDKLAVVTRLIPDERNLGDVTATFTSRLFPNADESEHGPFTLTEDTDVRFTGRQVKLKVTGAKNSDWRVGDMRVDIKQGERKMRKLPVAGPDYDYKLENIRNSIIEEELALTHRKLENIELGDGDLIFTDDSGNQKTVRTLQTAVDDPSTGLSATASAVSTLSTDVSTLDGEVTSLSSSVTSLSTTVGSNTTSINTNASSINGIEGKYAVKVNNNGHVSGFGLISTANNATPTSTFTVTADAFKVVNTSGSATPAAPFAVYTSSRTVDGVTVPAGVYMENANITSAQIKTLNADVIAAGTINADRISVDNVTLDTSGGNLIVKTGGVDTAQIADNAVSFGTRYYQQPSNCFASNSGTWGATIWSTTISATIGDKFYISTETPNFVLSNWTADAYFLQMYTFLNNAAFSAHTLTFPTKTTYHGGIHYGGIYSATATGNLTLDVRFFTSNTTANSAKANGLRVNVLKLER